MSGMLDETGVASPSSNRPGYDELPVEVRRSIEDWIAEPVTKISPIMGGFSPGLVARMDIADGRRIFIKALPETVNSEAASLYRTEIAVCRSLPRHKQRPSLLWANDSAGWITLLFDYVDGRPPSLPWRPEELRRVMSGIEGFSASMTPPPVVMRDISAVYGDRFTGWRDLADLAADDPQLGSLDSWTRPKLADLARTESRWVLAGDHDTLLHGDLRSDNLLLVGEEVVFVDWPWACIGPAWYDLMMMLPSVRLEGGPEPMEVFAETEFSSTSDPEAVTTVLTALTGFFVRQSLLPPPSGVPGLREFQWRQGEVALRWLKSRWTDRLE